MVAWNVFRIIGDLSHAGSICVLLWAIHKNKSAEGSYTPCINPIAYVPCRAY